MRRSFATTPARRDLLQDLYIKELKAYKAPAVAADDSVGQVKPWSVPPAPLPPSLEAATPADLSEYDSQIVEVEGIAVGEEPSTESLDDWFVVEPLHDEHH
ncbi:ATP synthase complex subunit H-domain-containing protein [Lipomyces oligophaga]|uniref:ATP synthase complex subunit H-domain-containing protein n=1 Tax=Lipomyces oligophaga TaxID=45792 RepID=UPI0034CFFFEB